MNVENLENLDDVNLFLTKISYGKFYFTCNKQVLIKELKQHLAIVNEISGSEKLKIEKETDEELLNYNDYSLSDDIQSVVSSLDRSEIDVFLEKYETITDALDFAFCQKKTVYFELDYSLYRYAKKMGSKLKVAFGVDDKGPFFNGSEKELNTYEKIIRAFRNGDDIIEFSAETTSIATVRCYVSTISKMCNRKIKCGVKNGNITVFLKPVTKEQELKREIQYKINEFDHLSDAIAVLHELLAESVELKRIEDDSEDFNSEIVEEKQEIVEDEDEQYDYNDNKDDDF